MHGSQLTSRIGAGLRAQRSQIGLDWLNFFIADVQTGFGPFVAIYLALAHWSQSQIGLALAIGNIAGVVCQAPGGALVDAVAAKRVLIGIALAALAASALMLALWPEFWAVAPAEVLHGAAAGIIQPALAALALGLVGRRAFSRRLGRNQLYNSLGTAVTAGTMGLLAHFFTAAAPFFATSAICIPALLALTMIRGREIDYAEARSASDRKNPRNVHRVRDAARNRHLHVFFFCLFLFQVANAALVPLATARLGYEHEASSELITSGAVVVPQLVTAILAIWVARRADDWGRKPLLMVGLGAVTVRAALFAVATGSWWLVPLQALDGLSAAVIGVLMPLVIGDLVRGSGRYNLALGTAGTVSAIGATLSMGASGYLVEGLGYTTGFAALSVVALGGIAVIWRFLPETNPTD
jgi:MFS family permease